MHRTTGVAFAVSLLVAVPVTAGPIAPGETKTAVEDDRIYPMPPASQYQGALLAERSQPFRFDTVDDEGVERFVQGTFTSLVYRDAGTGGLAFLHELSESGNNSVHDLERLFINGLGTLPADVYASDGSFAVHRTPGGDQLQWNFDREGIFGSFLVRTPDAGYALHPAGVDVFMDFEPSGNADGGAFAAYAPLPEPGGAAVMIAAGALLIRRRRVA